MSISGEQGRRAAIWLVLSLVILVLDQGSKSVVVSRFAEFESITLNPFLDFMRLHNEGVAFSMFADSSGWQRWVFSVLGIVVCTIFAVWLWRLPFKGQYLLASGLACIIGGALGNVVDRILRGHVVDFIRVHYGDWYFPAFNVADSAITVGAVLFILDSIVQTGRSKDAAQRSDPDRTN